MKGSCLTALALPAQYFGEIVKRRRQIEMIGSELLLQQTQRFFEKLPCVLTVGQPEVGAPHGGHQTSSDGRLFAEIVVDTGGSLIEDLSRRHLTAADMAGVGDAERLDEEVHHLGGGAGLGVGSVALDRDTPGLEGEPEDRGDHQSHQGGRERDADPVPADEFVSAIEHTRRAGQDGFDSQMATDVLGQLPRRGVASRPVLVQRLHDDPIEVSA